MRAKSSKQRCPALCLIGFYNLAFPSSNGLDFLSEGFFLPGILPGLLITNKISKNLLLVSNFQ